MCNKLGNPLTDSQNLTNTTIHEKTQVVYGIDNVITKAIERWRNTEEKMDSCIDKLQPKLLVTDKMLFPELLVLIKKILGQEQFLKLLRKMFSTSKNY